MPSKTPSFPVEDAVRFIQEQSFSARGDRGPVGSPLGAHAGVEVEWLTFSLADPGSHVPLGATRAAVAAAGALPGGCRVTFEPGGQLELSSPADLPPGACQAVAEDLAHLRRHLSDAGIGLVGIGLDPLRGERRVLRAPRYTAMERYFNSFGTEGRTMMCSTTSVQVNLDMGSGDEVEDRWRLVHLVGPVFTAAFANSPFHQSAPTAGLWIEGARHGLAHPTLAAAARGCFTAAIEALPRTGAFGTAAAVTEAFHDRFVARGRSPADDLLDAWASTGALFPTDQPLEPVWT